MMKEELSLFDGLDEQSKKAALDITLNTSPLPLFSSVLKSIDEESDENTHLPENISMKDLQDILGVQIEDYLSLQMGTIKGTKAKEVMQKEIISELKNKQ